MKIIKKEIENSIPKKKIEDKIKLITGKNDFDYVGTEWRESEVVDFLKNYWRINNTKKSKRSQREVKEIQRKVKENKWLIYKYLKGK